MTAHEKLRSDLKLKLVAAHRAGNWELAKRLSAKWEKIKRRIICRCPGCGAVLARNGKKDSSGFCGTHWRQGIKSRFLATVLIYAGYSAFSQTNLLPSPPILSSNQLAKASSFVQQIPPGFTFTDDFHSNVYVMESSTDLVNWITLTNIIYQPASVTLKNNGGTLFVRGYWLLTPTNTVNTNIYHP